LDCETCQLKSKCWGDAIDNGYGIIVLSGEVTATEKVGNSRVSAPQYRAGAPGGPKAIAHFLASAPGVRRKAHAVEWASAMAWQDRAEHERAYTADNGCVIVSCAGEGAERGGFGEAS
jgi:hypothetical protein